MKVRGLALAQQDGWRNIAISLIDRIVSTIAPCRHLRVLDTTARKEFRMISRIWHGATPAAKSDEYLNLMRTVAIPDYRSTPGNKGAYALRRMEGDTAHFLCSLSGSPRSPSAPLPETISAWRNTTISTRISCWS